MVEADTIVHFYYDLEDENDYETRIRNYLHGLRDPIITEEIISIGTPFMSRTGLTVRVVARLKVSMDERPSCRHLDDYVSIIFPTIKKIIAGELISTQNIHITFARKGIPHHERKISWEELYHHWNK
ncbi:hypothetical protein J2S74_002178 [Evansella vedderi]|uniref:Uncharacterized protein n=1 Tax=Evansella vedderi TaxID=38282 RepID=A0ABT9ZVA1_9BACI|nr:hypothetical protein [Evansella vedderi]MDQ0254799.1 hypothetical protein [Evansella vedderi]